MAVRRSNSGKLQTPRQSLLSVDTEYLDLGGERFGISMGFGGSSTVAPSQHNLRADPDKLRTALGNLRNSSDPTEAIEKARKMLSVADTNATPGVAIWNQALDELSAPGGLDKLDQITESTTTALSELAGKSPAMPELGNSILVGSNIRKADAGIIEEHTNYNPAKNSLRDMVNVDAPSKTGGAFEEFTKMFNGGDGRNHGGFAEWATPQIQSRLDKIGVTGAWEFNKEKGLTKGYYGLEDMFHFTSGASGQAHNEFIVSRMKQAGIDINPEMIGGRHGLGNAAHGAVYDAVVTESVVRRLTQMSGKDTAISQGVENLLDHKARQAARQMGGVNGHTEAGASAMDVERDIRPSGKPSRHSKSASGQRKVNEGIGAAVAKITKSDMGKAISKSRIARSMKGKWGTVAALGTAAALAGGIYNERTGKKRRQMPANHISTDKLSYAIAMGGPF